MLSVSGLSIRQLDLRQFADRRQVPGCFDEQTQAGPLRIVWCLIEKLEDSFRKSARSSRSHCLVAKEEGDPKAPGTWTQIDDSSLLELEKEHPAVLWLQGVPLLIFDALLIGERVFELFPEDSGWAKGSGEFRMGRHCGFAYEGVWRVHIVPDFASGIR